MNFLKGLRRRQPRKRAFTATPHTTYADSVRLANGQLSANQLRAVIRRNVDLIHADRDDLAMALLRELGWPFRGETPQKVA